MTSLEILNKCHLDLFPKKKTICDDVECMKIVDQLPILNGEYINFIGPSGKQNEDILLATNFRIFLLMHESVSFINVPIMLVESIEIKEILFLYVYLKNAKTIRLSFSTSEKTTLWYQRLNSIISKSIKLEELFAFTFYSWLTNEKSDESVIVDSDYPTRYLFSKNDQSNITSKEYKRMNFNAKMWRLSEVNKNFELCPTYPETVIVPASITDDQLKKIACFRSSKRFPAVVWRSKSNGAVLARSSQPNVGLLGWRLNEDELLIKAIADSSFANGNNPKKPDHITSLSSLSENPTEEDSTAKTSPVLLIIDARFRSVALANRVKGGGYEYTEYYTNCELQFMNLENIHVIRSSFQSLRLLCQSVNDNRTFYSQLESTKWLQHLSGIIKAACAVTDSIDRQAKSVLIHCSDGWDRTPQILALAKLMLDPFYRTINGFRILVEQDWLMFGHKFAQRNGHADSHNDVNERCPVFLQWLDCVYQIQRQFSWAFEFNETFLLKLCYHSYSCLFGTFLCDSVIERVSDHIEERTFSIWSYLNSKNREIVNYLYDDSFEEVVYPNHELVNMQLWSKLFCDSEITYLVSRHELQQPFSDSVDMLASTHTLLSDEALSGNFLNGSSQQIDDDLDLEASSVKRVEGVKEAGSGKMVITAGGQQNKTRSFEDLSKSFRSFDLDNSIMDALKRNMNTSALDDSTGNLNNLSASDFPISIRSCSESNLLLDALQTITSTSPKQICYINGACSKLSNPILIKTEKSISSSEISETKTATVKEEESGEGKVHEQGMIVSDEIQNQHVNDTPMALDTAETESSFDITDGSLPVNLNNEQHLKHAFLENKIYPINVSNSNSNVLTASLAKSASNTSLLRMQDSTDTLVDEASLVIKQRMIESVAAKIGGDMVLDEEVFELASDRKEGCTDILANGISNNQAEVSSTPLSSSIPSPDTSMLNMNHFKQAIKSNPFKLTSSSHSSISDLTSNSTNKAHQSSNGQLANNNTVSTSTSGLSDYVTSAKFRYINDTIKSFEKNFNDRQPNAANTSRRSSANGLNGIPDGIEVQANDTGHTDAATSTDMVGFCYENRASRLKSNGSVSSAGGSGNRRIASKSIPIVRKNCEERNKKKKTIQDCIDIDGLTKVDDKSCRKIVERDNQYKKEIASLKEQVNKCKSFLTTLTTSSHLWQDGSNLNNFIKNDLADKSQVEDSHITNYSFSNDSVCSSSWDEIEEADYRLAPWVPDYYVTHCQGCNNKFSYRLRKHHCRNCGQVFCYQCADQFSPLPNYNLTAPARVCYNCMMMIEEKKSMKQSNCKSDTMNSSPASSNMSSSSSFLSNPIKYDKHGQKKILIQNHQGSYVNSNGSSSSSSGGSNGTPTSNCKNNNNSSSNCNLNQRCNQFESSIEFKQNGNKSQKVPV